MSHGNSENLSIHKVTNQKDIVGEIRAEKKTNHRKFEKENCVELFVAKLKTLQQPTANCMDYSYM